MKILITGASSGIGYKIAIKLLKKGHFVYMTTHTNEQCLKVVENLEKQNLKIVCFKMDITKEEDRHMIDNLDIDVLINNAAIGIGGSILDIDMNLVRENYEVNVFSSFELLKLFYENLKRKKRKGKVIIISSIAGIIPLPFLGIYSSTKAAISLLAETLNKELKYFDNILSVKLVELGAYHTGFNQVMIDNKEKTNDKNLFFADKMEKINKKQRKIFKFIESKDLSSAANKIVKIIESKKYKFKFRIPLIQGIAIKLYLIFCK